MDRSRRSALRLLGCTVSALLVAACGGSAGGGGANTVPDLPMAPDFAFEAYQGEKELGGRERNFSDVVALGKPIILNFWAARCPPCQVEMPEFQAYYQKHRKKVLVLGVDIGSISRLGLPEEALSLLHALKISYPAVTSADTHIAEEYELLGLPGTYFINSAGQIVDSWTGFLTKEKLEELAGDLIDAER